MRRPLFGTGIPKRALVDDGLITVFNTVPFTPQTQAPQLFAVTLYAWAWQNSAPFAVPAQLPSLAVTLASDGGVPVVVAQRFAADFEAHEIAGVLASARPVKLLDRLIVRGNQQVVVANVNATCSVANNMSCFVYGFFEAVGESAMSIPFRPLQPANPVAPFSAAPTLAEFVGPAVGFSTAHQLVTAYLDALTVNVNVAETLAAYATPPKAFLRLPGAISLPIPTISPDALPGSTFFLSQPFDGIPMLAPSATDNLVEVGITSCPAADLISLAAYGGFRRG